MPRARKPAAVAPNTANRTDLQSAPQPVAAATGQPYGEAGAQLAAQRAVPIAAPSIPAPPAGPPPGTPPAPPPPMPGQILPGGMGGPTQRPDEPVTAGLPSGPGPGPVDTMGQSQTTLTALLAQMAATPHATPEVQQLAAYVNSGRR